MSIGNLQDRPTTGTDIMREFLPNSPYVAHLGMRVAELGDGMATLELPFRDELVTIGRTVHGGALASLIDTAAMAAAWSGAEVPDQLRGSTVAMSTNFLAPADDEDVTAEAQMVRRGRRLVTVQVDVRSSSGVHVATSLVTYQIG